MRLLCILLLGWKITVVASVCPEPSVHCLSHRECSFGNLSVYNEISTYINNLTGCDVCWNNCGSCGCNSNSSVNVAISARQYCNQSAICKDIQVELAINYIVGNYEEYEVNFLRAQTKLIELCGRMGDVCCDGECTTGLQLSQPDPMCTQQQSIDPSPMRHWVSGFVILGVVNFVFALPEPEVQKQYHALGSQSQV